MGGFGGRVGRWVCSLGVRCPNCQDRGLSLWSYSPYRSCIVGRPAAIPSGALSVTVTCHVAVVLWENHSSPVVFSTEKPREVTIHALCLSLKQVPLDLGTLKYYMPVQ